MGKDDLINYIKQARQSGMADEQIKAGLTQAGYQSAEVDEAFASLNKNSQPQPPSLNAGRWHPTRAQKLIAVIGTVAIVSLALGYAYASYLASKNFNEVARQAKIAEEEMVKIEQSRSQKLNSSNEQDDSKSTSDWKIYTNEEFKFAVKYPEEWFPYLKDQVLTIGEIAKGEPLATRCYLTVKINQIEGSIIPSPTKINHYTEIEDGRRCDEILNQILMTFNFIQ